MRKRPAQTCPDCHADSRIGEEVHYVKCKVGKIDDNNYCDECNHIIHVEEETFEYGKDYICRSCWDRHLDEAEAYFGD